MKKIISCLVAVCMAAMSFVTVHCEDNIKVILDGKTLEFDVQPQIIDERTLVPMRVIFEALGADVEWEEETQTINARRSDTDLFYISMRVGDKIIHKETVKENLPTSNDIELDVPPMIIDERTLVPVRAVSECFGCKVEWNGVKLLLLKAILTIIQILTCRHRHRQKRLSIQLIQSNIMPIMSSMQVI